MFVLLSLGLSLVRALVHLRLEEQAAYDGAGKRREGVVDQAGHGLRRLKEHLGTPAKKRGGPDPEHWAAKTRRGAPEQTRERTAAGQPNVRAVTANPPKMAGDAQRTVILGPIYSLFSLKKKCFTFGFLKKNFSFRILHRHLMN